MVFGIQNLTARVGHKREVGERLDSHIRCIISMIGSKRLERGGGGQKMFGDGGKGEEGREAREGVAWGEEGEVIRACQGKKSMAVGPGW